MFNIKIWSIDMAKRFKRILRFVVMLTEWNSIFNRRLDNLLDRLDSTERNIQCLTGLILREKYAGIAENQDPKTEINKHELKFHSQNGEDGILLYIFSKIGTTNRRFVEFGIGDGRECNTANLSLNFGWHGLLMDAKERHVFLANQYYQSMLGQGVNIVQSLVTTSNINRVLQMNGFKNEIDLLSIDIDGNDYWIWEAMTVINPRVLVIEYNASIGRDNSLTVKYDPHFDRYKKHPTGWYYGASLAALTKLSNAKGYVLVGCESTGINAFFVRKDVAHGILPEVSVQEAYYPNEGQSNISLEQFESVKHLGFENI